MDIDNLKTFLEVHRTRHFGRAADNLYLTAAAVSARVKHLEQYLGVSLFIRSRGNVQLTREGERLLPHAENLVLGWTRTLQDISLQESQTTRLHLGATAGLWQFSLAERLGPLTRAFPDVSIQTEAHPDHALVRRLLERNLDIAILYEPPNLPELKSEKIGQLKLTMVSSIADQTLKSAFMQGYVFVDWGTSFAEFHANRFGDVLAANLRVDLASVAVTYLKENPGSAYLPRRVQQANDFLHPVKGAPSFNRPLYACYREGYAQPELMQGMLALLAGVAS